MIGLVRAVVLAALAAASAAGCAWCVKTEPSPPLAPVSKDPEFDRSLPARAPVRADDRTSVPGDYAGKFHDYVIEWSPQQVRMTVDGKQIYYSTHAFKDSRWFAIVVSNGTSGRATSRILARRLLLPRNWRSVE